MNDAPVRPPKIIEGRYLGRESLLVFFQQYYPNPHGRDNHVGKLFSALIQSTRTEIIEPIPFIVLCGRCRRSLSEDCDATGAPHKRYDNKWTYLIEVESLRTHANDFMARPKRYIGPAVRDDLLRLLDKL